MPGVRHVTMILLGIVTLPRPAIASPELITAGNFEHAGPTPCTQVGSQVVTGRPNATATGIMGHGDTPIRLPGPADDLSPSPDTGYNGLSFHWATAQSAGTEASTAEYWQVTFAAAAQPTAARLHSPSAPPHEACRP